MTSNASLVIAASRLLAFFLTYPGGSCRLRVSTCRASASICARNSAAARDGERCRRPGSRGTEPAPGPPRRMLRRASAPPLHWGEWCSGSCRACPAQLEGTTHGFRHRGLVAISECGFDFEGRGHGGVQRSWVDSRTAMQSNYPVNAMALPADAADWRETPQFRVRLTGGQPHPRRWSRHRSSPPTPWRPGLGELAIRRSCGVVFL